MTSTAAVGVVLLGVAIILSGITMAARERRFFTPVSLGLQFVLYPVAMLVIAVGH